MDRACEQTPISRHRLRRGPVRQRRVPAGGTCQTAGRTGAGPRGRRRPARPEPASCAGSAPPATAASGPSDTGRPQQLSVMAARSMSWRALRPHLLPNVVKVDAQLCAIATPSARVNRFSASASRAARASLKRRDHAPSSSGGSLPSQLAELAVPGWPPGSHPCDGALGCHGGGAPACGRGGRGQEQRHASAAGRRRKGAAATRRLPCSMPELAPYAPSKPASLCVGGA